MKGAPLLDDFSAVLIAVCNISVPVSPTKTLIVQHWFPVAVWTRGSARQCVAGWNGIGSAADSGPSGSVRTHKMRPCWTETTQNSSRSWDLVVLNVFGAPGKTLGPLLGHCLPLLPTKGGPKVPK